MMMDLRAQLEFFILFFLKKKKEKEKAFFPRCDVVVRTLGWFIGLGASAVPVQREIEP